MHGARLEAHLRSELDPRFDPTHWTDAASHQQEVLEPSISTVTRSPARALASPPSSTTEATTFPLFSVVGNFMTGLISHHKVTV